MTEGRDAVAEAVRRHGCLRLDAPVQLRSGHWSRDFVDGKAALARGEDLRTACEELLVLASGLARGFDAVGGPTMGADHLAHGMALLSGARWFAIRKEPKGRGTNKLVEGAALGPGVRALMVEDVATTGGSLLDACEVVAATGADIVGALTLVDRGPKATARFAERGLAYGSLLTWADVGIDPLLD